MAMGEVLNFYENVGSKSARENTAMLSELENIVHKSEELGLAAPHVETLVCAITSYRPSTANPKKQNVFSVLGLRQTQSERLISCLVPQSEINAQSVRCFAIWTLTNYKRLDPKLCLGPALRWINCVLQYSICPMKELHCLYEGFFQLLDIGSVRPIVCDILFKLTANKKGLVTKWRIQKLSQLNDQDPENPWLITLLMRMQDLRPDLVKFQLRRKKALKGSSGRMEKTFSALWKDTVRDDDLDIPLNILSLEDNESYSNKRWRKCLIPPLTEDSLQKTENQVSLYECRTLKDLVDNLHRLKEASQAMSLIGSPHTYYLLFLTRNSEQLQERLSITLYYTLHNEFFSLAGSRGQSKRKFDLLCRINQFQDYFQQGLPVVGRFLVQYLANWDGEEFFVEICKMLVYIQITEFPEIEECILSPLRSLFNCKFTPIHQLLVLTYLGKLAQHWASMEYERCKNCANGPFPMTNSPIFGGPLDSIFGLVETISQMAESGLCQLVQKVEDPDVHKLHLNTYIQETLVIFLTLSRCLLLKEIPLWPKLPKAVVYFSLFGRNPTFMTRALEYFTLVKQEIIPMIKRSISDYQEGEDQREANIATRQLEEIDEFNAMAKDANAILTTEKYLARGESIFRQEWMVDDEKAREGMTLTTHPVFLPYSTKYGQLNLSSSDMNSREFEKYYEELTRKLPCISDFFEAFRSRVEVESQTSSQVFSLEGSASTSGISSMHNDQKRKRRKISK